MICEEIEIILDVLRRNAPVARGMSSVDGMTIHRGGRRWFSMACMGSLCATGSAHTRLAKCCRLIQDDGSPGLVLGRHVADLR